MKTLAGAAVLLVALEAAPARAQDSARITLERTACFGICPVYKVTMRKTAVTYRAGARRVRGKHLEDRALRRARRARDGGRVLR